MGAMQNNKLIVGAPYTAVRGKDEYVILKFGAVFIYYKQNILEEVVPKEKKEKEDLQDLQDDISQDKFIEDNDVLKEEKDRQDYNYNDKLINNNENFQEKDNNNNE